MTDRQIVKSNLYLAALWALRSADPSADVQVIADKAEADADEGANRILGPQEGN